MTKERTSPLLELNDYDEVRNINSTRFNSAFFDLMTKHYWEYKEQKLADMLGWGINQF